MRKKIAKTLLKLLIICLLVYCIYHISLVFRVGKQSINVTTNSKYYIGDNLEAIVNVKNAKTNNLVKAKLKVELLNNENKKVKGVKELYQIEEGEEANVSLELPKDIETGNYTLKLTATSGIKKDTKTVNISFVDVEKAKTVISLDKGIYKPGDNVNFRALITSKKTAEPISEDVNIEIYDGNGNRVYNNSVKSSEFGIVSGTFSLADEVNSGEYKIVVSTNAGQTSKKFTVNPYVTPKFEASISSDKESYLVGDTAQISLNAKYFFGEPVKNAAVTGTINDEEVSGLTNEEGILTVDYKIEDAGSVTIDLEVVDSSNYYIEASKTVYAGTDVFEVEVLPENGNIINGIDNEIYILTKTIDGKSVKTHATITLGSIKKQVITDDNGIGKFTLTASEVSSLNTQEFIVFKNDSKYDFDFKGKDFISCSEALKVDVTDMNENNVKVTIPVIVENDTGVVISTDKVKYNQGDDINLTLHSATDINSEKVFIYKNDELLKMYSTDSENMTINLDDISGLVDIYVMANRTESSSYYSDATNYYKKTIFIKPSKALNITIDTDAEEYQPGDTLNIKFETTDETNEKVDSALLVSILDEAVLSLAENDLSIDNIKLALDDIELADGVSASDLYTNIIDNSSEELLMSVLLKQSYVAPNIVQDTEITSNSNEDNTLKAVISGTALLIIIIIIVCVKSKRFSNVLIDIINCLAIYLLLLAGVYEILYYDWDFSTILVYIAPLIFTIIIYALLLYKKKNYIFKLIFEMVIFPGILLIITQIVYDINYNELAYLILLIPVIIYTILVVKARRKPLSSRMQALETLALSITKAEIIYTIAGLIISLCQFNNMLVIFSVPIIIYIIVDFIYNKNKRKTNKSNNGHVTINLTGIEIIGVTAIIVLAFLGIVFIFGCRTFSSNVSIDSDFDDWDIVTFDTASDSSSSSSWKNNVQFDSATSSSNENVFSTIMNSFSNSDDENSASTITNETTQIENETTTDVEANVRNVFLESLAFIPELVTSNGTAETSITISDNITTWNIQTVGNTKEGNIGFNTASIKVFKEFFIDFSLPTNSVVTDKTSIPVTVYNYKSEDLNVELNVVTNDWSTIGSYEKNVIVPAGQTKMVYVPIEITTDGSQTLRIEAKANGVQDIVERTMKITPNGAEKTNVISSGVIENKYTQDFFTTEEAIANTRKVTVKIYPTVISQVVEGMENILKMPTGCFEQTSSSLYPDILVLNYLNSTGNTNDEVREKALEYISKGYQRILTYEVKGEKGGYSLYGENPAETVITAFGLMEVNDLKSVYDVEDQVIDNMIEFLFKQQKLNGKFDYNSTYIGNPSSSDELAMNAYITWALSEVCPEDSRLEKSVQYLENNLNKVKDNYTLALIANVFSNTNNSNVDKVINNLMDKVKTNGDIAYISSETRDYWGSYGASQNLQSTALTSMVLTKEGSNTKTNNALINYIISNKDSSGTWRTTQATILSLKALSEYTKSDTLAKQTISVTINDEVKNIEIGENPLDIYETTFTNINNENSFTIEMKKGKIYYEVVEDYYVDYTSLKENEDIKVSQTLTTEAKVNDIILQNIKIENSSASAVSNGLIQINIPQGCSVIEDSLLQLEYDGIIEKYEYNYGTINLYIRNWIAKTTKEFTIEYRAEYPENITGGFVRVYDYYNPTTEGMAKPENIVVTE